MPGLAVLAYALLPLLLVNLWTFWRFRDDKRRAVLGRRRIPEARLLGLALIGGSPAALLARQVLRHKTRKQPFSTWLWLVAAVQCSTLIALLFAAAR